MQSPRWSPFPGLRLTLACVTVILTARPCGLSYPQGVCRLALSTLAGTEGAVRLASLPSKVSGVLVGVGSTLVCVGFFGRERGELPAWLSVLAFVCAGVHAWTRLEPFALAVGTMCFPATIFAVNDRPHALTAVWSRAGESNAGIFRGEGVRRAVLVAFPARRRH